MMMIPIKWEYFLVAGFSIGRDRLEECQNSENALELTRKVIKMEVVHSITQKYFVILRLFVQKVSLTSLPFRKGGLFQNASVVIGSVYFDQWSH